MQAFHSRTSTAGLSVMGGDTRVVVSIVTDEAVDADTARAFVNDALAAAVQVTTQ